MVGIIQWEWESYSQSGNNTATVSQSGNNTVRVGIIQLVRILQTCDEWWWPALNVYVLEIAYVCNQLTTCPFFSPLTEVGAMHLGPVSPAKPHLKHNFLYVIWPFITNWT